jgi:hypothetical protein
MNYLFKGGAILLLIVLSCSSDDIKTQLTTENVKQYKTISYTNQSV